MFDDDEEDDHDEGFEEDLVPSSLSDLLTPQERERRNSRHLATRPEPPQPPASASSSDLWGAPRAQRPSFSAKDRKVLEPIGTPGTGPHTPPETRVG